ncbi:MAG: hypothetical protein Q7T55_02660 [Solirubrobacteraceae bacterium]|nr:hypothetical protein [Solirubrobacteraceae bacterium]
MQRILITGVRGKTGVPLARSLAVRDGVEVLGGSSDPSTITLDGVVPTAFSWDEAGHWPSALTDVDAVFVVRPDRPDAPELIKALLAITGERTRVVLLSERDVDWFEAGSWAHRVEEVVKGSERSWTILRPSWFLQVLADSRFMRDDLMDGTFPFAGGDAEIAWIDARDIAAVAEHALLEDGHDGQTYELSGPEALTSADIAAQVSEALGHPVERVDLSIGDAVVHLDGFDRELTVITFERVRAGSFAGVTDTVERVTGQPARTLGQFLADGELDADASKAD